MNIKRNSLMVLGLVFGVSVILYIFDVPIAPSSIRMTPTISVPTILPTTLPILTTSIMPAKQGNTSTITSTKPSLRVMSETIDYLVRGIPESMIVNVCLNGAVVTNLQLSQKTDNGESAAYQDAFLSEIKQYVEGKNLKDISISRVAGASYTSDAFMQAIDKMKSQI